LRCLPLSERRRVLQSILPARSSIGDIVLYGPATALGNAVAGYLPLIIWCKVCNHLVEPDDAEIAARYGAEKRGPGGLVGSAAGIGLL